MFFTTKGLFCLKGSFQNQSVLHCPKMHTFCAIEFYASAVISVQLNYTDMNIEKLRDYCLSLPGVTEKMPFEPFFHYHESFLVFYVKGHIFCLADIDVNDCCTVKCDPPKIAKLEEKYSGIGKPFPTCFAIKERLAKNCICGER